MPTLLSVLLLLAAPVAAPTMEAPSDEMMARLEEGEVVVEERSTGQPGESARASILVHAPAKDMWEVITSCEMAFVYTEGLKVCEILENSGASAVIHQEVKSFWLMPRQEFTLEAQRVPYRFIQFELREGSLRAFEGSWDFLAVDQGTVVVHEVRVRPPLLLPAFIVRRTLRTNMPDSLAGMRALAGGSGSVELRTDDLQRCGGPRAPPATPAQGQ